MHFTLARIVSALNTAALYRAALNGVSTPKSSLWDHISLMLSLEALNERSSGQPNRQKFAGGQRYPEKGVVRHLSLLSVQYGMNSEEAGEMQNPVAGTTSISSSSSFFFSSNCSSKRKWTQAADNHRSWSRNGSPAHPSSSSPSVMVKAFFGLRGNKGSSDKATGKGCFSCAGKGAIECQGCKGTGKNKKNGNMFERWKCYDCQGFGLVGCPKCGTGGLTPEQRGER
ncbi:hypothetical protein R1flu_002612 [Riccia fluitans]|uniref:Uncharacterized protein n=1 Tax=Riccia fluitans TaxID=41844 RepID=A0ABD1Y6L0_9MARC